MTATELGWRDWIILVASVLVLGVAGRILLAKRPPAIPMAAMPTLPSKVGSTACTQVKGLVAPTLMGERCRMSIGNPKTDIIASGLKTSGGTFRTTP
jgi:hypothetical protein